jgi:hypothetical protein
VPESSLTFLRAKLIMQRLFFRGSVELRQGLNFCGREGRTWQSKLVYGLTTQAHEEVKKAFS